MLQLDDLLQPDDGCYIPPSDVRELFKAGSALFEESDLYKFDRGDMTGKEWLAFTWGYQARLLDVCLKTGLAFGLWISHPDTLPRLVKRAEGFNREVKTFLTNEYAPCFIEVSAHKE